METLTQTEDRILTNYTKWKQMNTQELKQIIDIKRSEIKLIKHIITTKTR